MPYLGREPQGILANTIEGNLKVTGTISADSINDKLALNGSDNSSPQSNANDQIVLEAGTLDDATHASVVPAMAATDNLLLEDVTPSQAEVPLASIAAGGTSGQVLQSQGSLVTPAFVTSAATGWEFVSSTTASGASDVSFTGFTTGYDFKITAYAIKPSTDGQITRIEVGTGGGPTYQTSNYSYGIDGAYSQTHSADSGTNASNIIFQYSAPGNSTNEQGVVDITIFNPGDSSNFTHILFNGMYVNTTPDGSTWNGGGFWENNTAVTAARIFSTSGNINGVFKLYKRANA